MASNFITKQEVIDLALEASELRTENIPDAKIEVSELKYIRPAVTEDLFNRLNQANDNLIAEEVKLKELLKNALAFYVGYLVIPGVSIKITNRGTQLPSSMNSNVATDRQRGELRGTYLAMAETYTSEAVKYIEDNIDSFREYYSSGKSVSNRIKKHKGIIF